MIHRLRRYEPPFKNYIAAMPPRLASGLAPRRCPNSLPAKPVEAPVSHVPSHVEPEVRETVAIPQVPRTSGPRLVDVSAAADYLGVSVWTVRDLVKRGSLPRVELPGIRRVLVDQTDLDRSIDTSRLALA